MATLCLRGLLGAKRRGLSALATSLEKSARLGRYLLKGVSITEVIWDRVHRPGSIGNAEGQVTGILFGSYAGVSCEARIATLHGRPEGLCSDIG